MSRYLVSVLVPIYNVEKYIERCAISLFEQTYEDIEYIFVDDCSPDNSISILKEVMERYPQRKNRVRILQHEKNRGLSAARNTAINAASGLFISHVDSDDYLDPDAIRLLVEKQLETGADIVTGNHYIVQNSGIKKMYEAEYNDKPEMLKKTISANAGSTHVIWGRLINLRLYRDYHIQPKEGVDYAEDWQQIAKLVYYADKVAKISNHIYYYNCINNSSYVFSMYNKPSVTLWNQHIESATLIKNFFSDKEQEYRDLSRRAVFYIIKTRMSLAAKWREKEFFENMKQKIKTEYADCYDEVGWDNLLVRAFMCNYTLNGIYRRLLSKIKPPLHH